MTTPHVDYQELPDHVRRIIDRDGELHFTPPSFERWLGRLQMFRTLTAMGGFSMLWATTWGAGLGWEMATLRGMIAAIAGYFFAWAVGLFVFGEIYDSEVKAARHALEERERERARRIEQYYRDRLRAQDAEGRSEPGAPAAGHVPSIGGDPLASAVPGYVPRADATRMAA